MSAAKFLRALFLLSVQRVSELQSQVERLQRELEQEVLRREEVGAGWSQSEPKLRLRVLGGGVRVESVGVRGPPESGCVVLGGWG